MLSRLLREILFTIVHLLFSVVELFGRTIRHLWILRNTNLRLKKASSDVNLIALNVSALTKKPQHLVIVHDSKNFTVVDLANFVIWSLIAGIPYISFYDCFGSLHFEDEKLFTAVEEKKIGIPGCIKWASKPDLNGYSNGTLPHIITVNIYLKRDCKEKFACIIRNITKKKILHKTFTEEFTAEELDVAVRLHYNNMPDPDLAIYGGPVCTTKGLLPWQIRLTEFIHCPSVKCVQASDFLNVLGKYSKCDQRFGR